MVNSAVATHQYGLYVIRALFGVSVVLGLSGLGLVTLVSATALLFPRIRRLRGRPVEPGYRNGYGLLRAEGSRSS